MRFLFLLLSSFLIQHSSFSAQPNVVFILADDFGYGDLGCMGGTDIATPNIDRLAAEGVKFTDFYANAPVCTPTRTGFMTGRWQQRCGIEFAFGYQVEQFRRVKGEWVPEKDFHGLGLPLGEITLAQKMKAAGYATGAFGKWHLGFKDEYNPVNRGFDEYFGIPATNDRLPTVFVRDYRVVGLDPADPIRYSYNAAEAKAQGLSPWAAGRNRIGWAKGGKAAWWKDTEIADTLLRESVQFIEKNKERPFFLLYAPHNVHAPAIPGPRFAGRSGLTPRADMLQELDACIGELLQTLDRHGLAKDTLILYSSDNGAYVTDEKGHKPCGPLRGKKSQLWEGGHRVPFIVRWPARIQPGVSEDIVSTLDMPATICAAAGIKLPKEALPDSHNLLPALLGEQNAPKRDHLILMSGNGDLAIRDRTLKYIPSLTTADG